mgnify:CR=1 FL=1
MLAYTNCAVRMGYLSSRAVKKALRGAIYDKLLRLGASYSQQVRAPEIVQGTMEGVDQLETYFGTYLPQFFYATLAPLILFIVPCFVNVPAAVVLLICVPMIPVAIAAVQTWAKMGVTGASSEPVAEHLKDRNFCTPPTSTVYCPGQRYVSKEDEVRQVDAFLAWQGVTRLALVVASSIGTDLAVAFLTRTRLPVEPGPPGFQPRVHAGLQCPAGPVSQRLFPPAGQAGRRRHAHAYRTVGLHGVSFCRI